MRAFVLVLVVCLTLVVSACGASPAATGSPAQSAPAASAGPIQIVEPWTRASIGGMGGNSATYLVIRNTGTAADRLVKVDSDVAKAIELHTTEMQGNTMSMRPVAGGIEVPAGGQVELKPGGYHVMLIGLNRELKPNDRVTFKLQFEKAGAVDVQATVKQP